MNPDLVYVKYSILKPKYMAAKPKERFDLSNLPQKEVTYREFQNTISIASTMVKNYRGKILVYDMIGWCINLFGLILIIGLGAGTSSSAQGNWGNMVLYMLLYFIMVPVVYKISKCFQDKYLRQSHFVLAIVCRAENNRYYLKRGVECRPGYLGRWIEFNVLDNLDGRVDLV